MWQTEVVPLPESLDGAEADAFRRWDAASARGFLSGRSSDGALATRLRVARADGRVARQVVEGDQVVGTFAEFPWRLDLGRGAVPFWAVTGVTVAPTHRRRGMLRDMMTASLARAAEQGLPLAGLTATEGAIYGRFGFGVAGSRCSVDIEARDFALRAPASGEIALLDPADLAEHLEGLAALTRAAWPGVFPMERQRVDALAVWDYPGDRAPTDRFAAVHRNARGEVRGAVVWTFEQSAERGTLVVKSLLGAPEAVWRLIGFCCEIDLVQVVRIPVAPPLEQVRAAAVNPRAVRVTDHADAVWLRPLDVAGCVAARPWGADGEVILAIDDPLGYAQGTWRVRVEAGQGRAERVDRADTDARVTTLAMSAETFGALLGDGRVADLALAGRIEVRGDAHEAERILGVAPAPWHNVLF